MNVESPHERIQHDEDKRINPIIDYRNEDWLLNGVNWTSVVNYQNQMEDEYDWYAVLSIEFTIAFFDGK